MPYPAILHDHVRHIATPVTLVFETGRLVLQAPDAPRLFLDTHAILNARRLEPGGEIVLELDTPSGKQVLEVAQADFLPALQAAFPERRFFRRSFFDRIGVGGCLVSIALFVVPALALYVWGVPAIADSAARSVSSATEKQIGDSWFGSLTADFTIDTLRSRQVQQFYDSLGFADSLYDMRISVVREPVVNAFAVPGGHIVVFDSMIGILDAPEQLAALLAHEASHIRLKHSTRAIFRELATSLFFQILLGDTGDMAGIVARHGDQLAGLSYSRQLETEADENGMQLLTASGIPPRGMSELFQRMKMATASDEGAAMPDFLSTHPAIDERLETARRSAMEVYTDSNRMEVLQQLFNGIKMEK